MEILLFVVLIGLIPAMIARSKGRDFLPWWTDAQHLRPGQHHQDRRRARGDGMGERAGGPAERVRLFS